MVPRTPLASYILQSSQCCITPLRSVGPLRSNNNWLCLQLLPWPFSKPFPLFQIPPVSFSLSVFVLCVVLWGFSWKMVSLWQRNPISMYVWSTSISTVRFELPLVSLVHASTVLHLRNVRPEYVKIFPKVHIYVCRPLLILL